MNITDESVVTRTEENINFASDVVVMSRHCFLFPDVVGWPSKDRTSHGTRRARGAKSRLLLAEKRLLHRHVLED